MSSSPETSRPVVLRGGEAGGLPAPRPPREGAVLRGGAAVGARPYRQSPGGAPPAPGIPPQAAPIERRMTVRRAEDQPVAGSRPTFRLGEVYAEELERLRARAHAEGYAAGHAEGMTAAADVVAEAERAAVERLTATQEKWERRIASATAALGAAASRLDEAAQPTAEEIRETILASVLTLVEDLVGRELALADSPVLDAVRRALTLCPADAPAVVRVHPDDLAEIPADALEELPASVRVVADPAIERAGAVAESGSRRIDAQLVAAVQRVQSVLAP
ncbi:FliH/SctL family protein [Blastococcus sp. CCUG 61487]|uniref:FliH/SctL family protein n=1 Tax=Blastococcus sp. CCUG 61487 TaxID=1840703 RepID=UPI0010C046D8|nr:FliH/SctL family protein [Blastococcus sp. CCUG 61487]